MALRPIQQVCGDRMGSKRKDDSDEDIVCEGFAAEWSVAANKRQKIQQRPPFEDMLAAPTPSSHLPEFGSSYEQGQSPLMDLKHSSPIDHSDHSAVNPLTTTTICNCGNPENDTQGLVRCVNAQCKIGVYHKVCVGLASRKDTSGWPCRDCRPKPPARTWNSIHGQSFQNISSSSTVQDLSNTAYDAPSEPSPLIPQGPSEPALHHEQERVVRCIEQGDNVFYTGSAGTGKSTVLKAFVQRLKKTGKQVVCKCVAPILVTSFT